MTRLKTKNNTQLCHFYHQVYRPILTTFYLKGHNADTLDLIVKALGNYDLGDIFADTKVVVATDDLVEIKETVDIVEAEHDRIPVENEMLKTKNSALTMEIELLKKELQHKEELLALHNYYNKLKQNG